ncbi:hypothetical protein ACIQGZ_26035 [Streptomyces sp. NPDC092296]|uniref:hypothetical protein n=1 Tax=Streptomyces sp. NPDC092296 TaxID=3366012 RepID=UPI0037F456C1
MDGLEAARRVLAQVPDCRVITLTAFDLDHDVHAALAAAVRLVARIFAKPALRDRAQAVVFALASPGESA